MGLCCPRCKVALELQGGELRAIPRPFRTATLESIFAPPDVRRGPAHPSSTLATCEHCDDPYWPARGSRRPRYCSKSCARRAVIARKHGFTKAMYRLALDLGVERRLSLDEAAAILADVA